MNCITEQSTSGNESRKRKNSKPASKRGCGPFSGWIRRLCTKCCAAHKRKKAKSRIRKPGFWKRLKEKCKNCKRKRRTRSKPSSTSTVAFKEAEGEISEKKPDEREKGRRRARRSRRLRERGEREPAETFVGSEHLLQVAPPDFTKSCCYLCAQNTMAVAAAISNQIEKSHISIQSSAQFTKGTPMSDKGCSPAVYVRTVQSSVKVKMRDMSTSYAEGKKSNKPKYKFKLKKLIPNITLPKHPKVRTVACETDKPARRNNAPQCKARRGTHCVTEKKQ